MSPFPCIFRAVLCLAALLVHRNASALTLDADAQAKQGYQSSIAVVDGHPAVAWSNGFGSSVKYARALDPQGSAWGPPVVVDTGTMGNPGSSVGGRLRLLVVNGNPAVCYHYSGWTEKYLKYSRATDSTGTAWSTPLNLNALSYSGLDFTMEIVDGRPAIAFLGPNNPQFLRATDSNGSAWAAPVDLPATPGMYYPGLKVVDGRPAIIWANYSGLWYVRANDAAGSTWPAATNIAPPETPQVFQFPSMQITNGRPSICYYDKAMDRLRYLRATDAAGAAWPEPFTIPGIEGGDHCSLALVQGKPAIAFHSSESNRALRCVTSIDGEGATAASWGPPTTIEDTGDTLVSINLLEVDGQAALTHHNEWPGSLHYLRAGSGLWPPNIKVEKEDGTIIPNGGGLDVGVVNMGTSGTLILKVQNPHAGSGPLSLTSLTFEGPDAASFTAVSLPESPIAALSSVLVAIECRPILPGVKNATLLLRSNTQNSSNPFRIRISADASPHLGVEQPTGTSWSGNGGDTILFPPAFAGGYSELVFTVRNSGGADLNIQSITFGGSFASDFSHTGVPAPVPPAGSATFTVRCTPVTTGTKTTEMVINSNARPAATAYNIDLRMIPYGVDPAFSPELAGVSNALAVQIDGRILVGGQDTLNRFHADGSIDTAFFAPPVVGSAYSVAVQDNGMILLGGVTRVGGASRGGLARIHPDGTLDQFFDPKADGRMDSFLIQSDGKVLMLGNFQTVAGQPAPFLARVFPDGSLDTTFRPPLPGGGSIDRMTLQAGGKIVIGGSFTTLSGAPAKGIARLRQDGTLDAFPASLETDYLVTGLAALPDGRVWVSVWSKLIRFFPNGNLDVSIPLNPQGRVDRMLLQADGKLVVSGFFDRVGGYYRSQLARINEDGTVDTGFDVDTVLQASILCPQKDGKILTIASVRDFNGNNRLGLARLNNYPATGRLFNAGNSTVRWLRGGSAPELSSAVFELKTADSLDWEPLGSAVAINGGWELTGLSLPANGEIRAFGRSGGSVFETTAVLLPPLESWRMQYFSTAEGTGIAADDADPDHDGLSNFLEFAFGLSPVDQNSHALPAFQRSGDALATSFTAPSGMEDILQYSAEWSPSMQPDSWAPLPDTGTGGTHLFKLPFSGDHAFVRFAVKRR